MFTCWFSLLTQELHILLCYYICFENILWLGLLVGKLDPYFFFCWQFFLLIQGFARIHVSLFIFYQILHYILSNSARLGYSTSFTSSSLDRLFWPHNSFDIDEFFFAFFLWVVSICRNYRDHKRLFNLLPWSCICLHFKYFFIFIQNWIKNLRREIASAFNWPSLFLSS